MVDTIQYLQDTIERDYIENKALLSVLKSNNGYDAANWFAGELHDAKKKRIIIANFLDVLDEYKKKCSQKTFTI